MNCSLPCSSDHGISQARVLEGVTIMGFGLFNDVGDLGTDCREKTKDREMEMGVASVSSVQFSCSVVSNSLRPHELQHARPPCPSPTPGVHPDSCPLSQWCHPAISSSVVPFSSCPQSLSASGSFPMSQLFAWGGQSTGVSASASFPPKKSQGWSSEWLVGSPCSPRDSQESSPTPQFKSINSSVLSLLQQSNSHIHTWPLEKP